MNALEPVFDTAFTRTLFGLWVDNKTVKTIFFKAKIYLPTFVTFLFTNADIPILKESEIYKKHYIGLLKIAKGSYLFDNSSSDSDILSLRNYCKATFLPQASNTQGVEAKIKDVSLCKKTWRSEITITYFHNI